MRKNVVIYIGARKVSNKWKEQEVVLLVKEFDVTDATEAWWDDFPDYCNKTVD